MKKRLASLNTVEDQNEVLSFANEIKSVLLVDNNSIDNFVNHKLLEFYGVQEVMSFINHSRALAYLYETKTKYQFILIDIYLPNTNGFEFIDVFFELNLHKKHGEICLLSASLDPLDKEKAKQRNVRFIEKPLTIDKLLPRNIANYL